MRFLTTDDPLETRRRHDWAKRIARSGLHVFVLGAYDDALSEARPVVILAAEQRRRRAFIAMLHRERVVRQWMLLAEGLDEPVGLEAPCGAPLLLAGERWKDFAAELAAVTNDEGGHTPCDI